MTCCDDCKYFIDFRKFTLLCKGRCSYRDINNKEIPKLNFSHNSCDKKEAMEK
jgi:hypothetical protein